MSNTRSENAVLFSYTARGDNHEQQERLRRNLPLACEQALTPRQRQLLRMHFEQQMSEADIARALSLHRSTVSRTLLRARRRLHDALQYSL